MDIRQVIETYSPIDRNPYECYEHVVKVMHSEYDNGEVEFASFFCSSCRYSYKYTDLDAYKTMQKSFVTRCYDKIKSLLS